MNSLQRDQMIETFYLCGIKKAPSIKRLLDRAKVQASERTIQRKIKNLMEFGAIEEEKTTKKGRLSTLSDDNKMEIEELLEEQSMLNSKEIVDTLHLNCTPKTVNNYRIFSKVFFRSVMLLYNYREHIFIFYKSRKYHYRFLIRNG